MQLLRTARDPHALLPIIVPLPPPQHCATARHARIDQDEDCPASDQSQDLQLNLQKRVAIVISYCFLSRLCL